MYLLSSSNLIKETGKTKKDNTFGLETDDEIRLFAVENKDGYHVYIPFTLYTLINWRYGDWITQLETMKKQFPSNDDAVVPKQKRASVLTKAKKNITGKVVSSSMGRDALKSILDEDARENFGLFKQLLVSEFGEEKANEIEADIIKLMVKGYLLYNMAISYLVNYLLTCEDISPTKTKPWIQKAYQNYRTSLRSAAIY